METNPEVRTFEIDPPENVAGNLQHGRSSNFNAVVTVGNGTVEYHQLISSGADDGKSRQRVNVLTDSGSKLVRIFSDADLYPRAEEAMRWLKLIGYGAAIREEQQTDATVAIAAFLSSKGDGTVHDLLARLQDFDLQIVLGVFSRMAILGDIALDLSSSGFTLASRWTWRNKQ
ncbi:hypothetical protein [Burkholderia lata]|uniref:hypothetical protein n=1 Tax=Burkholderia lata (strain ATCC 17760 / DSM 23089 / LMG 22485 / NCIMB 9086 / R18194 / 383) TaxID=482957 RepID=UPI001583AF1A|nr:hypothetical protein [Burkholderia lata]